MNILGIETSCDETAVAIVNDKRQVLANMVLSQQEHKTFGGVVPEVAARAHLNHIDGLIAGALEKAKMTLDNIDAIAVTAGPGLIGGVLVGAVTAKAIAAVRKLPVIAVNHLEGHALTARLTDDIPFPFMLLLVSGGHSQILMVEDVGKYKRLGSTIDDAVGEAFDKTAKLMGLGYPGGPAVEKMATKCKNISAACKKFPLPRPMLGKEGCDFSFSGLKTAVRRIVEALPPGEVPIDAAADICASFQRVIADILVDRIENALDQCPAPALVVAGGVAANRTLRAALENAALQRNMRFVAPPLNLCTDNAAMIAWAGIERFSRGQSDDINFPVHARWPLDPTAQGKGK